MGLLVPHDEEAPAFSSDTTPSTAPHGDTSGCSDLADGLSPVPTSEDDSALVVVDHPRPATVLAALPCYLQPVLRRAPATHSLRAAALLQNDELPLALERAHDAVDTVGRACEGDSDALPLSGIQRLRLSVRSALAAGAVLLVYRLEHGSDPRLRLTPTRGRHPAHGSHEISLDQAADASMNFDARSKGWTKVLVETGMVNGKKEN
ncbi:hypothetical protein [Brachybacterium aquaticum]|uniref:Uncharacterized protein n=1 Tax=Brachybacterium aquaticum TaxID=1432564 RepID=A0A841AAU1_9MICO|nr:hypothetical protein [Brachybacterium aquaticum]MBB5831057.1 hypothetical protein [Brachybacterium aquaticum]